MRKLYKETKMSTTLNEDGLNSDYDFIQIEIVDNTVIYECIKKPYDKLTPIEELHSKVPVDINNIKITKEQLVQLIYNNFYDKSINIIDLVGLDFRNLKCDVAISELKIGGSLYQLNQEIGGSLYQVNQEISGNLWQDKQVIGGDLDQTGQVVKGRIVPTEKE